MSNESHLYCLLFFFPLFWDLTGISSLFLFLTKYFPSKNVLVDIDDCPTGHHIFVPMFCPPPDSAYQCVETTDGRGICNHKCHLHVNCFFRVDLVASRGRSGGRWKLARSDRVAPSLGPARGRCGNAKPAALMLGSLRAGSGTFGAVLQSRGGSSRDWGSQQFVCPWLEF